MPLIDRAVTHRRPLPASLHLQRRAQPPLLIFSRMGPGRPSTCLCLSPLQTLLLCFFAVGRALSVSVHEACENFHPGAPSASSSWGLVHCARVWNTWSGTTLQGFHEGYPDREVLRQLSGELRRRGSPCIVRENGTLDGLGSSTFSHIAAWLYSKDVGCNWIIPDIHQGDATAVANPVQQHSTNLQAVYCDRTKWIPTKFNESRPLREDPRERRCAAVTWLRYLHLDSFSVPPPRAGVIKTVEVRDGGEATSGLVNENENGTDSSISPTNEKKPNEDVRITLGGTLRMLTMNRTLSDERYTKPRKMAYPCSRLLVVQ